MERMSTKVYQSENYERVFEENEALLARVQRAEVSKFCEYVTLQMEVPLHLTPRGGGHTPAVW